ncbi:MAG: biopolymer transporter ExbD [Oligoflexia bacterium]|nr:biopolymer transporter ExbD [Oligoflexia bacterium]
MVSLSLTSMVDMFAILVIFLLVNSSTVSQWIEVSQGIELPKASKTDQPKQAVTLQISMSTLFGEQKALAKTADIIKMGSIDPLIQWLKKQSKKEGYVNLVAHEKVPFGVIKRVIATCQDSGFSKINLAVQPSY